MRQPQRSAWLAAAILTVACGADPSQPPDGLTLHVSADSLRLWVGDTVRVTAEIRGPDGAVVSRDVEWESRTPAAEVQGEGLIRALAPGTGIVRARGAGQSADVEIVSLAVVRGRVHAADGGDLEGIRAAWRGDTTGTADTVPLAADGGFAIRVSAMDARGELLIDGNVPRAYHPFLFPFTVAELESVDVVLVPRAWTIDRGTYEGQTVPTLLDHVVEDNAGALLYTYYFGQPYPAPDPRAYLLDLMTWPTDRFPAAVAFDHGHGDPALTAQDSAEIWAVLNRLEAVFGQDLFEPVDAQPGWWPDPPLADPGLVPGVIRLVFSPPLWGGLPLSDETPRVFEGDLGVWAPDGRFSAFRVQHRRLNGGTVIIGALDSLRLADGWVPWETVLMHEVLHVLGVGHTCRVPSTQGPCVRTSEPSAHDVAYIALLREILRLSMAHDTFYGMLPAVIGERRRILDRPALPDLQP